MHLQFRIVFMQGSTNMPIDALSRCHAPNSVWALSFCRPEWLQNVKFLRLWNCWMRFPRDNTCPILSKMGDYTQWQNLAGIQYSRNHVIQAIHNSGVRGHSKSTATYYRIKQLLSWPGMRSDIQRDAKFANSLKWSIAKSHGLLQALHISYQAASSLHWLHWKPSQVWWEDDTDDWRSIDDDIFYPNHSTLDT